MRGSRGRSLTRTDRQLRAVTLVSGAGLLSGVVYQSLRPLSLGGDSGALVRGARGIVDCLRRSRFTHCERFVVHQPTGAHAVIVGQFALLQYVPAVALRSVDLSVASTLRALVLLNAASLVAIVALAHVTLKRLARSLWAPLVTAALIASPLICPNT